ncbi:MAG: hypothetical protein ACFFA0_10160 [Promethearchaeota archaeon]
MVNIRQVKGTMVAMIAKSIKYNKSKQEEYDRILSDKAKQLINQRILSSAWYPYELYKEAFNALSFVEARNNPRVLIEWGRVESERLMTTIYKLSVFKGNIQIAADKYARFHRMVFNFGEIIPEIVSDTKIIFTYEDFDPNWENVYHVAVGYAQAFIELCIDKKTDFSFLKKSWKGEGWTQIMLTW